MFNFCSVTEIFNKLRCATTERYMVPANMYLFKVNNKNIIRRCETCSKLTIKTPERRQ